MFLKTYFYFYFYSKPFHAQKNSFWFQKPVCNLLLQYLLQRSELQMWVKSITKFQFKVSHTHVYCLIQTEIKYFINPLTKQVKQRNRQPKKNRLCISFRLHNKLLITLLLTHWVKSNMFRHQYLRHT
jgi:hypothetical protein